MTSKDRIYAAAKTSLEQLVLDDGDRIEGITTVGRHACTVRVVERERTRYFKLSVQEMV